MKLPDNWGWEPRTWRKRARISAAVVSSFGAHRAPNYSIAKGLWKVRVQVYSRLTPSLQQGRQILPLILSW